MSYKRLRTADAKFNDILRRKFISIIKYVIIGYNIVVNKYERKKQKTLSSKL